MLNMTTPLEAQELNARAAALISEIERLHDDAHPLEQGASEWRRGALRDARVARSSEFARLLADANGWVIPREPPLLDFDGAHRPLVGKNNALLARLRAAEIDCGGALFDHERWFLAGRKVAAIASHPYVGRGEDTGKLTREDLEELAEIARHACCVATVPAAPSWYYPHRTAAIIFSDSPLAWPPGGVLHQFAGRGA